MGWARLIRVHGFDCGMYPTPDDVRSSTYKSGITRTAQSGSCQHAMPTGLGTVEIILCSWIQCKLRGYHTPGAIVITLKYFD